MGDKSVPAPPDYTPIAAASQAQTNLADQEFQTQTGLQQQALDWARGAYATDQAQNQKIIDQQIATQNQASTNANQAQQRYQQVYQPLEDQAVHEAETYASPEQKALQMGAASATVATQFDAQRRAAAANLESFGIDPSSTRYAALDAGSRSAQAAAQAGAANAAGQQVDATGRALQANAINVGRGLPSDVNAGQNTSINAGNAAVNAGLATTASGASTMGTSPQYGSLATGALNAGTQAVGTWGNTVSQGYQGQLGAFNASQNASSGIGSALGIAAGFIPGLADGGAVPSALPTRGGAVPVHASPSKGKAIDDVPARLTAGEFVIPRDVMQWKGEEFYQKQIQKAREDRKQNAPAQPRAVPASNLPAAFMSRPAPAQALPTR